MLKFHHLTGACASALSTFVALGVLAGCTEQAPSGQVVAVVAGTDVTRRELATEATLGDRRVLSQAEMRGPVLADLVDRKLLVARARRDGLDLTPEYLAAMRRDREILLASMAARQIAATVQPPSTREAVAYVREHPALFSGRTLFLVEDRQGDTGARQWIDSAQLPAAEAQRLAAAQPGARVVVAALAGAAPLTLVARRPAPVAPSDAVQHARSLLQQSRAQDRIEATIGAERARTRVRYQHGFGPAAQ